MCNSRKSFLQLAILIGVFLLAITSGYSQVQVPGRLDPSFGTNGKVVTDIVQASTCLDVALQSDGKIVCVGQTFRTVNVGPYDFAVVRYNSDGTLDKSFSDDGMTTINFLSGNNVAQSVVIQTDGKIVVAGYAGSTQSRFAIARFNTDGSLDTSFDGDGKVLTQIGFFCSAHSIKIQSDGKMVVAGVSSNGANLDFAIARYNTDGSLDTTFDDDGKLTTAVTSGNDYAFSLAIQTDGKIVAGGVGIIETALVRYNQNGSLDTSFSNDGIVVLSVGAGESRINSLTLQPDGKIVVVGQAKEQVEEFHKFFVGRFNTDGTLDSGFGNNGKAIIGIDDGEFAESVALQPDGKIVVAGRTDSDFAMIRLNSNGSLDQSFDGDGKVLTNFLSHASGYSTVIQPDGRIIVAGNNLGTGNFKFALARYYGGCSVENSCFNSPVTGRVLTLENKPVRKAVITVITADGVTKYAFSNPFGNYRFGGLIVGDVFTFTVKAKGKSFQPVTIKLTQDNLNDLNFISNN